MNIQYRKVQKNDNALLAKIIRDTFDDMQVPTKGTVYEDPTTDNFYSLFDTNGALLWVAIADEKAVGCCGLYPTDALPEGHVELVKFYLDKKIRGKGIGKILFEMCLQSAKELGYTQVYLESFPHFKDAINMYEKYEFVYLKNSLGNSGHFGCNVWMLKNI